MKQKDTQRAYVTKAHFDLVIEKLINEMRQFRNELRQYDNEMKQYRNENMNRLDQVMGELANFREDNTVGAYQIRDVREEIYDHEKRIKALEKTQSSQ